MLKNKLIKKGEESDTQIVALSNEITALKSSKLTLEEKYNSLKSKFNDYQKQTKKLQDKVRYFYIRIYFLGNFQF